MKINHLAWTIGRFAVVFVIFAFLYKTGQFDPDKLKGVLIRPGFFLYSIILICFAVIISIQRWRILLRVQNVSLDIWIATKLSFIGFLFSAALPGMVSGDIVKAYYLTKGQEQKTALVTTIVIDRLLGLYALISVASLSVLITFLHTGYKDLWSHEALKPLSIFICLLFVAFTLLGLMFLSRGLKESRLVEYILTKIPIQRLAVKVYDAVGQYGKKLRLTLYALLLSFLTQFLTYTAIWLLALTINMKMEAFVNYLFAIPVSLLINAIPLAPGGLGVGEAGFQGIFLLFGCDGGAELAFIFHVVFLMFTIGGGGLVYLFSDISREEIRKAACQKL